MNKIEQLYLKVEDCPNFEKEDLKRLEIPIYIFNKIEYIKINICGEFKEDWKSFFIVDIELQEMKDNENVGAFNGLGETPKKDFFPLCTNLIMKGRDLK